MGAFIVCQLKLTDAWTQFSCIKSKILGKGPRNEFCFVFLIPSTGRSDLAKCEYDEDLAKCGPLKSNMAPLDTRGWNQQAGAFLAFREENEIISSLDF